MIAARITKDRTFQVPGIVDERRPVIETGLIAHFPMDNLRGGYRPLYPLNYDNWVLGTSGSQPGFNQNGTTTENKIVEDTGPFNQLAKLWEASGTDVASGADGGWDSTTFPIDPTKMYRFSVWIRRKVIGNGQSYLGLHGYGSVNGVKKRGSDTVTTNPYFWVGNITSTEWRLFVGHVWPHDAGIGSVHAESGVYQRGVGKIGGPTDEFRWLPETTSSLHRTYLYYSTDITTVQQFAFPRVDIIDGTEPTIDDLLMSEARLFRYDLVQDVVLDKRGISVEEPSTNYCPNYDGNEINPTYMVPGVYQPGWDTSLHPDAIAVNRWSNGYNSGVPSPTKGYHARWVYMPNEVTGKRQAVMLHEDRNDKYGLGHRWMGLSCEGISSTGMGLAVNGYLTISWDQMVDNIGKVSRVGLYHKRISTGTYDFETAIANVSSLKVGQWERKVLTFQVTSNWDLTAYFQIYVYGHHGDYGRLWCRNFNLEKGQFATSVGQTAARLSPRFKLKNVVNPHKGTILLDTTFHEDYLLSKEGSAFQFVWTNRIYSPFANSMEFYAGIEFKIRNSDATFATKSLSSPVTRENRTRLAFVYDDTDGTMDVYQNGALVTDGAKVSSLIGKLGSLGTGWTCSGLSDGDGANLLSQTVHSVTFYNLVLSAEQIKKAHSDALELTPTRALTTIKEHTNLNLPFHHAFYPLINNPFMSGSIATSGQNFGTHQQSNCVVLLTKSSRSGHKYCFCVRRPPNLVYPDAGNTMWGGVLVYPPEWAKREGRTYRMSYYVKGQSSAALDNAPGHYPFSVQAGWTNWGMELPLGANSVSVIGIPGNNFYSEDWQYVEYIYTVKSTRWSKPKIYLDCTAGSPVVTRGATSASYNLQFDSVRTSVGDILDDNPYFPSGTYIVSIDSTTQLTLSNPAISSATNFGVMTNHLFDTMSNTKIGFSYNSTGALGSRLFIDDITFEDITDDNIKLARVSKNEGVRSRHVIEGMHRVQLKGTANLAGDLEVGGAPTIKWDGVSLAPAYGRGLTLVTWKEDGTVLSNQRYDTHGVDADRTALAAALAAIEPTVYWALVSYDACQTNATLDNQMRAMGAFTFVEYGIWASNYRSPYAAFGRGQRCFKEDLRTYGNDRWYATIDLYL